LPALYHLTNDFVDIQSNNNGYASGPGYDLVTGAGSPLVNELVPDLANTPFVASTLPANGSSASTPPASYRVAFTHAINPSTLQAGALSIDGVAASSVTLDSTNTVATFTFATNPVTKQGTQILSFAAGSVSEPGSSATNPVDTATFYYDATTLAVSTTNPPSGPGIFQLPATSLTYDVTFNEPLDPSFVNINNLVLSQGQVASVLVQPGNQTVQYTLTGVTAEGPMTISIPTGTVKDQYDNPASPSFTGTYFVDNPTQPFPTPLQAVLPLGSQVYQGSVSDAIAFANDTDIYTLALAAGQTVTVQITAGTGLQPAVMLRDPANHVLGAATAPAAGQSVVLQTIPTTSTGVYTITVSGAGGTEGSYTLSVVLNAATRAGPPNSTRATAQDIDDTFLSLGSVGSRGDAMSALGPSSGQDYYSFSATAGDSLTLAGNALNGSAVSVTLQDDTGATLFSGVPAANVDSLITDFVAASTGTYYAIVAAAPGTSYNLMVARNADYDTGGESNFATASPVLTRLSGTEQSFGYVNASSSVESFDKDSLAAYTMLGLGHAAITAEAAHDGPFGLELQNQEYVYREDAAAQVKQGETLSVWFQIVGQLGAFTGLAYGVNTVGTLEVGADSSDQTFFLSAAGSIISSSPQVWQPNKWYRIQLNWGVGGHIIGQLFDSDGTTLLNTVTGTSNNVKSGGIGFACGYSTAYFDSLTIEGLANHGVSDADFYKLPLDGGSTFQAETATPGASNYLDPELLLFNSANTVVASDDNSAPDGRNALLKFTVPVGRGGTYYLEVASSSMSSLRTSGDYVVTLNGVSLTAVIAPVALPNWTVSTPGYSQAITVNAAGVFTISVIGTLPPGLTLSSSGVLSGTPTVQGSYSFSISARDSMGNSASRDYTIVVNPAVTLASQPPPTGILSVVYRQTLSATGGTGSLSFSVTGSLPAGLSLSSSGVLSGTPTAIGGSTFTVTATDTLGTSASQSYTMFVFSFTPSVVPSWTVNQPGYNQTIVPAGGTGPYAFSATGTLPPGLAFSTSGALSGMPSAVGIYNFTVTAMDSAGTSARESYTAIINARPNFNPALPAWTVNQPGYRQTLSASGGTGAFTFMMTGGTLPVGITLSGSGILSGTPTAVGSYTFGATAIDSVGAGASQNLSMIINPPLALPSTSLPSGTAYQSLYDQVIPVSGGTVPFSFTQTGGILPPGLTLSADGELSGVPSSFGLFIFTVTCTDAAGSSVTKNVSVRINQQISIVTLSGAWTVSQPGYNQTIATLGGTAPDTFSSTGTLPPGVTLSTDGVLTGTPTTLGRYTFTVTATDSTGISGSGTITITINPPPQFATSNSATWTAGLLISQALTATGGTGVKTFSAVTASLPPGINVLAFGNLSGTPTTVGTYMFTITATDQAGATATQLFTMVVNPAVAVGPATLPNWTINRPGYSQTFTAMGGTGSLTLSESGTLPAGLTLTGGTTLSGTPTAVGSYTFSFTAKDSLGATSSQSYTVVINPAVSLPTISLPADTANVAYSYTITATGGTGALALTISNIMGAIPGLNVAVTAAGSLAITGTPTVAGTETFTVTATDMLGSMSSQDYTVVVNPGVLITTSSLANWTESWPGYVQTITAVGGTGILTFGTATLPAGLTLNSSTGVLSGTPMAVGTFGFTVTASDSLGAGGGQSYTVIINPPVSVTGATLGGWTANLAGYNQSFSATGGTGTLAFSLTGTLPPGLTLSSSGVLTGTPTIAGSYTFTVTATDMLGAGGGQTLTVTINPAVMLSPGLLPAGTVNVAYNQSINSSGGTGAVTLVVSNITGTIPGLTLAGSGTGTVAVTGTPTAVGTEQFTVTATDTLGASTSITYSITVNAGTVYLTLAGSGYSGTPGGTIVGFPISINELQDETSMNHVGLQSATLAVTFPKGVFSFPLGTNNATADVSLGSVPLSDTVSPGGAADWNLSATSLGDGQLNITLTAKSGKSILTNNPATGGSLVLISFPVSATYNPTSPTTAPVAVVSANGSFHTSITGSNGAYILKPAPPYAGSVTVNPPAGAFSQYLVSVISSRTIQAGHGFLVAVQAADSSGNPVTSYSGPSPVSISISPTSSGTSIPASVDLNGSGLGYSLATIQKAGSYTISVTGGSNSGTSSPITVVPGPAVKLGFAATPTATPTGDVLPPVTVQVEDLYGNLISSDNSDIVTFGVATGPGSFTSGSTLTAGVHNGVATFTNLTLVTPGTYQFSAVVPGLYTGPYSGTFSVLPLQVVPGSFVGTPSGFSLQFNVPILVNSATPVLYGQSTTTMLSPAPSVIVTTDPGDLSDTAAYVPGSLIFNAASNTLTFLATNTALEGNNGSPLLPDATYTVLVRSSASTNGLQALNSGGGFLDGLGMGTAGSGDFMATFRVNAAALQDDVLWVPATADGPGQALNAPGKNRAGGGYPIYLNDHSGAVTQVQLTLNYDPTLLTISGVTGAGFSLLSSSIPGQAVLQYRGPPLPAGSQIPIGFVMATVPGGTTATPMPYRAQDLLHLANVSLSGGSIPVATSDGLHLVAYVGDANGDGAYSGDDALRITRVVLQTDTGFAAYPRTDPVIVADTDGSGFIPADASLQVNEAGVGVPTENLPVPPIPTGVHFQAIVQRVSPSVRTASAVQGGATASVPDLTALVDYFAQAGADTYGTFWTPVTVPGLRKGLRAR
jgi:Putative Ig domain/Bacterial pre-peptidase C-terminal domain